MWIEDPDGIRVVLVEVPADHLVVHPCAVAVEQDWVGNPAADRLVDGRCRRSSVPYAVCLVHHPPGRPRLAHPGLHEPATSAADLNPARPGYQVLGG